MAEADDEATAHKRRPHRKSRTGCAECRRRRIKCGEQKPRCTACVRYDLPCAYRTSTAASTFPVPPVSKNGRPLNLTVPSVPSPAPLTPPTPASIDEPGIGPLSSAVFSMHDMALLHHWTRHASRSITGSTYADELWQGVFPRIAFQHAFVMSALLSLSALHLAHLHAHHRQYYLIEAARHNHDAVKGLRENLEHITPQVSDALFACSSLTSVYIFTSNGPLTDGDPDHNSPTSIKHRTLGAEWLPLLRGVSTVLHPVYQYVKQGPLAPLMLLGNWDATDPDAQPSLEDEALRSLASAWSQDPAAAVYNEALLQLRRCQAFMRHFDGSPSQLEPEYGYNGSWSGPFIWLHGVSQEFVTRLHQRQPFALLVFAHFGAVLHKLDRFWITSGWGGRIVQVVDEMLGSYWEKWMQWPREAVGMPQP